MNSEDSCENLCGSLFTSKEERSTPVHHLAHLHYQVSVISDIYDRILASITDHLKNEA